MATDLLVGFRREDILFAWAQLDKHVVWAPARPMVSLATYQAMVRAVYAAAEPDSEELESPRVALPLEAATRLIQSIGPPRYGVLPSDVQPKQASSKAEALSDAVVAVLPKPQSKGVLGEQFIALLASVEERLAALQPVARTEAYGLLGITRSELRVRSPPLRSYCSTVQVTGLTVQTAI